jgi:hypothetical protein
LNIILVCKINKHFIVFKESESFFLPLSVKNDRISNAKNKLESLLNEKKNQVKPKLNQPILSPILPAQRDFNVMNIFNSSLN